MESDQFTERVTPGDPQSTKNLFRGIWAFPKHIRLNYIFIDDCGIAEVCRAKLAGVLGKICFFGGVQIANLHVNRASPLTDRNFILQEDLTVLRTKPRSPLASLALALRTLRRQGQRLRAVVRGTQLLEEGART